MSSIVADIGLISEEFKNENPTTIYTIRFSLNH